jgi:hypothetical protein
VAVEKVRPPKRFFVRAYPAEFSFSSLLLSGNFSNRLYRLVEEARQALEVLGRGSQEELLAHELQSPQT